MDTEDETLSFVIECTEVPVTKTFDEDTVKARQKLLDKCAGTPKPKDICKSFKQMCDFEKGPLHTVPTGTKTHLGGV